MCVFPVRLGQCRCFHGCLITQGSSKCQVHLIKAITFMMLLSHLKKNIKKIKLARVSHCSSRLLRKLFHPLRQPHAPVVLFIEYTIMYHVLIRFHILLYFQMGKLYASVSVSSCTFVKISSPQLRFSELLFPSF